MHCYLSSFPEMDFATTMLFLLLTCIAIKFLSLHARSNKKPNYKLPPGPSPLTIILNLIQLAKKPQQTLAKLARVHGPIMRVKLGQLTTIVISSADIAQEVLQTHDVLFSNRTIPHAVTVLNHDHFSLPFMPVSDLWRDLRKICKNHLLSNETLDASQELRCRKMEELLNDIHRSSLTGEAVDIGRALLKTSTNILSNTFFSLDFDNSTGETEEYKDIVENLARAIATPNLVDFFPVLKMVDPQGIRKYSTAYVQKLFHIFDGLIVNRLKLREDAKYVTNNDMLDNLLNISQQDGQKMDNEKIKHLFLDLFIAGTDTTSYTIERAMAELIHNPHIMSKAKEELNQTIGTGNPIDSSDIAKLPYLQAIIKETLRLHPSAPLLLPRKAKTDVEIHGYIIPMGAQVLINEWAMGRNSSIWDNPNSFSPERFLGSEINFKGQNFQFTPFGSGRRMCPGMPLAIRIVPLLLGSLVNSFDWKLEDCVKLGDLDNGQPLRAIPIRINK